MGKKGKGETHANILSWKEELFLAPGASRVSASNYSLPYICVSSIHFVLGTTQMYGEERVWDTKYVLKGIE